TEKTCPCDSWIPLCVVNDPMCVECHRRTLGGLASGSAAAGAYPSPRAGTAEQLVWHLETKKPRVFLDLSERLATLRNVPRASSGRCPARNSQDPRRPRAREPGAPTATRHAPPPLEAAATWSARSRLLGVALQTVGAVARRPSRCSP